MKAVLWRTPQLQGRAIPVMNTASEAGAELLTVDDLASRLRVKRSWVYTHADDLGAYRLGKYLRFSWPRVVETLERSARIASQLHHAPNDREKPPEN